MSGETVCRKHSFYCCESGIETIKTRHATSLQTKKRAIGWLCRDALQLIVNNRLSIAKRLLNHICFFTNFVGYINADEKRTYLFIVIIGRGFHGCFISGIIMESGCISFF